MTTRVLSLQNTRKCMLNHALGYHLTNKILIKNMQMLIGLIEKSNELNLIQKENKKTYRNGITSKKIHKGKRNNIYYIGYIVISWLFSYMVYTGKFV